jgi:3-dehydroquinate dehydratase-2
VRHYRLLVLNGPNLNLLGTREPTLYGRDSLADVERIVGSRAEGLGYEIDFFQSHGYVNAVEALHRALDRRDQTVSPGDVVRPDVDRPVPVTERGREI